MSKDVIIIGAGRHGHVVADIIKKSGDSVYGFLDDEVGGVLGKIDDCRLYEDKYFIVAIGNNKTRNMIVDKYPDLKYYTAIHPSCVISDNVQIGCGTCVMPGAVINNSAVIAKHCIVNTNSVVEHDCFIRDYVHISPGAILCGKVTVGEHTHIGAGAVIRNNIEITSDCVVGAGAVVVSDIAESGVYVGVPAKIM